MIYTILLTIHSITRWLVLISAVYAIYLALSGLFKKSAWTKKDDHGGGAVCIHGGSSIVAGAWFCISLSALLPWPPCAILQVQ